MPRLLLAPALFLLRLCAAFLLLLDAAQAGNTHLTLQLKWEHTFQFAGYYAAQELGFYREAGLDVELLEAKPGLDPVVEVVAGRADFGIGNSSLLLARHAGQPVVALAAIFQHSPLVLIARHDKQLNSLADLRGRRVMLEPNAAELTAMLRQQGIDSLETESIPHGFSPRDLIDGKVDAMSAYVTNEPWLLDQAGLPYRIFSPRAANIDFYGDTLFTSDTFLRNNPLTVEAFRAASLRGWRYAMAHPEEMARLIFAKYSQRLPVSFYRYEARQMEPLVQADLVEPGYMSPERWRQIADTYANLGLLPAGFPLNDFLYAGNHDALDDMRLLIAGALAVSLGVALLALYALSTNRRLKQVLARKSSVEKQLRESESRYRTLFETSPSAAVVWIPGCIVTDWNRQAEAMFGWRREEVIGRSFVDFMIPEPEKSEIGSRLLAFTETSLLPHSINRNLTKDGRIIICDWYNASLPEDPDSVAEFVSVANDITQRKLLEDEVRQLAFYDTLTSLPNRRLLQDRLHQTRAANRRQGHLSALMLLDLDNLKPLNDTHGHEVGDQLLIEAARRMRQCLRETDTVARFGGDEFVILLSGLDHDTESAAQQAEHVADKVRVALATPYFLHRQSGADAGQVIEHTGSVSIGLTVFHDQEASDSDLLKWADIAMYQAKEAGRNRVMRYRADA